MKHHRINYAIICFTVENLRTAKIGIIVETTVETEIDKQKYIRESAINNRYT